MKSPPAPDSGALAEVQSIVARLYTDPVWLAEFDANPQAFVEARCGPEAASALDHIDRDRLRHFARSLRFKRAREASQLCPLTRRALGDRFAQVFGVHATRMVPCGPRRPLADAMTFVRDLRQRRDLDATVRQAAAYEWCLLSMRFALRARPSGKVPAKCEATTREGVYVRLRRFDLEFPALAHDAMDPERWPRRKTVVLFVGAVGRSAVWYW